MVARALCCGWRVYLVACGWASVAVGCDVAYGAWRAVPIIFPTSGIWSSAVPGTLYTGRVYKALYCVVRGVCRAYGITCRGAVLRLPDGVVGRCRAL